MSKFSWVDRIKEWLADSEVTKNGINEYTWMDKIWKWADEFRIPKSVIPRERDKLLAMTDLYIDFSYDEIFYDGGHSNEESYGPWERYIPNEIGCLSKLNKLGIACELGHLSTIPKGIGRLHNLTSLSFKMLGLTSLPDCVINLKNLVELDICYNRISSLPKELHSLEKLDISGNELDELPEWFSDS